MRRSEVPSPGAARARARATQQPPLRPSYGALDQTAFSFEFSGGLESLYAAS